MSHKISQNNNMYLGSSSSMVALYSRACTMSSSSSTKARGRVVMGQEGLRLKG